MLQKALPAPGRLPAGMMKFWADPSGKTWMMDPLLEALKQLF
ncbi:MAG: hypothetical protein ACI3Y7_01375 [Candidatus Cryptobacteroides sp.]